MKNHNIAEVDVLVKTKNDYIQPCPIFTDVQG